MSAPGWSRLSLATNCLSDVGATTLLQCVTSYHKLLFLDLRDNHLTSIIQETALKVALAHPYLVRIDLGGEL